ncbi:MAG: ice-binding family protein [Patescibacteria group bacterium]|nr:ice-binding family protein [Patescibacteria group bacterium]
MKTHIKIVSLSLLATLLFAPSVSAATQPNLGMADSFSILSGTYSNTTSGTTINGDLGYTTPPVTAPTVNGTTHVADATYNQAGIDQGTALSALNSQPCTFNFAPGAIDLATDTTHGVAGVYAPGIYCVSGAADIGGGGTITLTGSGTYIFRMTGALTTTANSVVAVAGGASACNVWWTPGAATTLGANSTFGGTVIDASGITIGNVVVWSGRALAFGGTVSTVSDTISSSSCAAVPSSSTSSSASKTAAASNKTPGLPNTGQSAVAHNNSIRNLALVSSLFATLLIVRQFAKRS